MQVSKRDVSLSTNSLRRFHHVAFHQPDDCVAKQSLEDLRSQAGAWRTREGRCRRYFGWRWRPYFHRLRSRSR